MLESMFYVLLIIAIIFLVLMVEWQSIAIAGINIVIWMVLAISVHQIQIPYQYTDTLGVVHESTQNIENLFPLSILFYGITIIIFLYLLINLVMPYLSGKIKSRRML